jgi:hypothetical protein
VNETYYQTFVALFLVTPPAVLVARFAYPKRMPWWLLVGLVALFGWVFSNLAVHFYYSHLDDLLTMAGGIDTAPQDLIDRWQNDGAKLVFAWLFGWLYGLIYLVPWLIVYLVFSALRRAIANRGQAAAQRMWTISS